MDDPLTTRIAQHPRDLRPLAAVGGVPIAALVGALRAVGAVHPGALPRGVAAVLVAVSFVATGALMIAGLRLLVGGASRRRAAGPLALGVAGLAAVLGVCAYAIVALRPEPRGWPDDLPRYYARCLDPEASDATRGGCRYERVRGGYGVALHAAGVVAHPLASACAGDGPRCERYRVGARVVVTCPAAGETVAVRYGPPPCGR